MKKIFTLIAAAMMAVCANAQIAWSVQEGDSYAVGTELYKDSYATITTSLAAGSAVTFADEAQNPTPKTINGKTFKAYVKCRVENLPAAGNNWEGEAGDGIAVKITATKNADIEIYARYGNTKAITLADATAQTSVATKNTFEEADGSDNLLVVATAQLQKDHTYVLCMRGGTMGLCGINVKEGTYVAPTFNIYANAGASTVDGFSTMVYGDGAKVALTGNAGKAYSGGSSITLDGSKYTSTKVSNGATNTFYAPEGKYVTTVDIVSYVNVDKQNRAAYWKEVNGVNYSLDGAEGTTQTTEMMCFKDGANPNVCTYEIGGLPSFTFTNTGEQLCFILKVTYGEPAGIKNVTTVSAAKVVKAIENGQLVIKAANGKFNVAGARVK